jgi:phosphoglycolate phosphatase
MKMIITDLDNTLYDWVTFFVLSFSAMVDELAILMNIEKDVLVDEFKTLHRYYGNIERPFTIFEIPSVVSRYQGLARSELLEVLNGPLYAFNSRRKKHLVLYEKVQETLGVLKQMGFKIVGYTEASDINGYYRLKKLEIDRYFTRLYAPCGDYNNHPNPEREKELRPLEGFIHCLPRNERKPNPRVLLDICEQEGIEKENVWYVGDSLTKDISMAKEAGIKSIWAKYGLDYDMSLWNTLVRVTHWTKEDIQRESNFKGVYGQIQPDYIIDSFDEILRIVER